MNLHTGLSKREDCVVVPTPDKGGLASGGTQSPHSVSP